VTEVIEFYEQQLHSTQRECASLRERHLDAEQRLLKALDSQRLRAIDGQQQLLRHSLSTASGLSMSSSAASLHSDVDRDVTAAGISKAASEAYSKQTAIMQRNLKDLQEKLSKCQTENEQWLKKERFGCFNSLNLLYSAPDFDIAISVNSNIARRCWKNPSAKMSRCTKH
jgi:hypothetical protein